MPLTDDEKGKIAWHLGWTEYPQVLNVSGIVVDHNIVTMLRRNIEECPESAIGRVRRCLCECDKIIDQISAAREKFGVKQVDGIVLDASEQMRLLDDEYNRWRYHLADMFGGHINLWSFLNRNRLGTVSGLQECYA